MSEYKIIKGIKDNFGIVACGFLISAVAIVGVTNMGNMGEVVYRGKNIKGQDIVYEEGRFSLLNKYDFTSNKMVVKQGDKVYTLVDLRDKTSIDWRNEKKPDFEKDMLEEVIIRDGNTILKYDPSDINTETIDGKHVKIVFENANSLYNNSRVEIRDTLREQYKCKHKIIEEDFLQK